MTIKEQIIAGPLAGVSIAYRNMDYVADKVFPTIDTNDPKVKITKYIRGDWFRDEAGIRAAGARANRGAPKTTNVSVSTDEYAFASEVTDEDRRFSKSLGAPVLQPETDAIEFAADKVDLKKERRVASLITSGTWADGVSGGADAEGLWSPGGSTNTFLTDIETGRKAVRSYIGRNPNVLLLDDATFGALKECESVLEKIKYTQRGVLTKELLAAMLDLDEVLVGKAVYSSANEKADGTDLTLVDIWTVNSGKGMGFLAYRPQRLGMKVQCAGLQYRVKYENGQARRTSTWREPAEHKDLYEVAEDTDIVQIDAYAGYLWKDTYAT